MTRSLTNELFTPFEDPERILHFTRRLFKTTCLDYSSLLEFDLFFDLENQSEEEVTEAMGEPTIEEYMMKTQEDYGSGIVRPKIDDKPRFELKGQFLKELRDNNFSGSDNEDENEHIEKVLVIVDLFHIPEEVILFYKELDVPTRQILDSKGAISTMKAADAKKAIQDMASHYKKWHNRTSTRTRSTETSDGLVVIQAQLNSLGREIKKVNERVYVAQVECESCNGHHYTKDCQLKEEGKTFEEAYYTQSGVPFPQGGRYRAAAPGFYQRDNGNPSYQERRQTMKESLSKFMAKSSKQQDENSNLIKEI
nr:hypothetical protein [Tanacetum cinerariifolium]